MLLVVLLKHTECIYKPYGYKEGEEAPDDAYDCSRAASCQSFGTEGGI